MVRKITPIIIAALMLIALCAPTLAATHEVYEQGNISTTYVQYFKDILSDKKLTDNYVAFRSGQYEYLMVVGELDYNNGNIRLTDSGKIYSFTQTGNYNSTYTYSVNEISNFDININSQIIYSDVGDYPELIERSTHIETLILIGLGSCLVFLLADRIFRYC